MLKEILGKKEVEFYSIEIQLSQIFVIIIVSINRFISYKEISSLKVATISVDNHQLGRTKRETIIDCGLLKKNKKYYFKIIIS